MNEEGQRSGIGYHHKDEVYRLRWGEVHFGTCREILFAGIPTQVLSAPYPTPTGSSRSQGIRLSDSDLEQIVNPIRHEIKNLEFSARSSIANSLGYDWQVNVNQGPSATFRSDIDPPVVPLDDAGYRRHAQASSLKFC